MQIAEDIIQKKGDHTAGLQLQQLVEEIKRKILKGDPEAALRTLETLRTGVEQIQILQESIDQHKSMASELENMVQERTKALQEANTNLARSNQELEQFAYVASHDLQEPLRKIQTFSGFILNRDYEELSPSAKDNFNRMQSAANRMQKLIEDLLVFSRTSTESKIFIKTDLNKLLQQVKEDLMVQISKTDAVIHSEVLPALNVIPLQFQQLFQNLISNALKFHTTHEQPQITITSREVDAADIPGKVNLPEKKYIRISFEDNGIGFESEFSDKIFQLFQRLHGRAEYPGTGIGLAICKKIMENHRGFILATGTPGSGARFDVYLPRIA
jgi:light-regulated signal transduction histidine kinase (bacteriophytochrome)